METWKYGNFHGQERTGAKGKLARFLARVFERYFGIDGIFDAAILAGGQGEGGEGGGERRKRKRKREREGEKEMLLGARNNNARPQKRSAAFLNLSGRRENRYTHEEKREM